MERSKFQFKKPELEFFEFVVNDAFVVPRNEEEIPIKTSVTVETNRSQSEREAFVRVNLCVGEDKNSSPFKIKITMISVFLWEEDADIVVDDLLRYNAPSLILGYMRPIVSILTSSSKYGAYDLPYLDLTQEGTFADDR